MFVHMLNRCAEYILWTNQYFYDFCYWNFSHRFVDRIEKFMRVLKRFEKFKRGISLPTNWMKAQYPSNKLD